MLRGAWIAEVVHSFMTDCFLGFKNSQTSDGVNNTPGVAGFDCKFA
jgi:hypothetical protein